MIGDGRAMGSDGPLSSHQVSATSPLSHVSSQAGALAIYGAPVPGSCEVGSGRTGSNSCDTADRLISFIGVSL